MKIIQMPLRVSPVKMNQTPEKMRRKATIFPEKEATLVASCMLLVMPQMTALNMRPPSRGKPGIRLKQASAMLIKPR
jgi:hypothetical protein